MKRTDTSENKARELLSSILIGGEEADSLPWEELGLLDVAIRHRLHLLLAQRLKLCGSLGQCPAGVGEFLEAALCAEAITDHARASELREVLDRLAHAHVCPILLKGFALAYTCYPQPYLRPRLDVDLLIRREDIAAAKRTMGQANYLQPNYVEGDRLQRQFHYEKHGPAGIVHAYDFHWRMANPELFANLPSFDEVEPACQKIPSLGNHARGLSDVHALFLACIHRVAHHRDSEELLWLFDIHLLTLRVTPTGWEQFQTLASQTATRAVCRHGLELATRAFQTPVPEYVMANLAKARNEPSAAFLRGGLREIDIQTSNFKSLRGWRARWQLIRQNLFPASSYMLKAYNVRNPVWLPVLYVHRIARGAPRWFQRPGKRSAT